MRLFIDFVFAVFSLFYLVSSVWKRKSLSALRQRFSVVSKELKKELRDKKPIWLHAVSVGETISASGFVSLLRQRFPQEKIIVSTVTSTANIVAGKIFPESVNVIYLPLDFSFIVRRAVSSVNPKIFILTETELWPNLIMELKKRNVPVVLINGRISDKSFRGYKLAWFLFKPLLASIDLFCMKSREDASKIIELGAPRQRVQITGSTKFDLALSYKLGEEQGKDLRQRFNIGGGEAVLVCGSTHKPEEKIIAGVYSELLKKGHDLKLIIAPRHIERADGVKKLYASLGIDCQLFSSLSAVQPASKKVVIVDRVGILRDLYSVCSVAFVGGSFSKRGGHNILEPAGFKKPVVFGKWIYNFEQEANLLIESGGAVMVENKEEFKNVLSELLGDKKRMEMMGEAAFRSLRQNGGAAVKNLEFAQNLFHRGEGIT